ncbi:unnamed protein product [marine sediment metagenome]|uniref:Uncharacterized protein n=1 Tax=marine sediment metagenome TaxID=412755 RepID=X1V4D5_9ZZZZ
MSRVIQHLKQAKQAGQRVNQWLGSPLAQGFLALANGIASFACLRASKKPLYRVCGGLLATFTGYHIYKAIQRYKGERGKAK